MRLLAWKMRSIRATTPRPSSSCRTGPGSGSAENTQIQLIDLNPDATTVDVASGLARLYNKSDDTVIKVTTPFGYVVGPGRHGF